MRVVIHIRQRLLHHRAHAQLVDGAHVKHLKPVLMHEALFVLVHTADADLHDLVFVERGRWVAKIHQGTGAEAKQGGHRHAVNVARRRDAAGVEVRMRIQPQHFQALFLATAMRRNRGDRTDGQAMIAAQQHRKFPRV